MTKSCRLQIITLASCMLIFAAANPEPATASDSPRTVVSGTVTDATTGEYIYGANVFLRGTQVGTATNIQGFYSIVSPPPGNYDLIVSYIGYQKFSRNINIAAGQKLRVDAELISEAIQAEKVIVTAEKEDFEHEIQIGTVTIDPKTIKTLPQMGEVDLFRSLQFLPGVMSQNDFASGLIIRGGNTDQNLILLDGITVYNPSHLGGFFSNFITDGLRDAELFKGGYSAMYGGRLSAVLDIVTKDGNNKNLSGSGEVSLISSKMLLEGPLKKGGWLFTARRTYVDKALDLGRAIGITDFEFPYYFYDVQANFYQDFSPNDRLRVSAYLGDDVLDWKEATADIKWGNRTISSRWRHLFSQQLFSSFLVAGSYFYTDFSIGGEDAIKSKNDIRDFTVRGDLTYYLRENHELNFGAEIKKLHIEYFSTFDREVLFRVKQTPVYSGLYVNSRWAPKGWVFQTGLRGSYYTEAMDDFSFAPRIGIKKLLSPVTALNISAGRYFQYIFAVNDEYSFQIVDNWVALDNTSPTSYADQLLFGIETTLPGLTKSSIEMYWKKMYNLYVYRPEFAAFDQKFIDPDVAEMFEQTDAVAWGTEFSLDRKFGAFSGNLSYTLSWVVKKITGEDRYWANWDRRHTFKAVFTYHRSKKWEFGGTMVYGSGQPYTKVLGTYPYWEPGYSYPIYNTIPGTRNNVRLPVYQRIDIGVTRHHYFSNWDLDWYFQIVNLFNRTNILAVNFDLDGITFGEPAEKSELKMFPIIPTFGIRVHF